MAKVIPFVSLFLLSVSATGEAVLHEPFPAGPAMMSLGTILDGNGPSGRNPLVSAAFMDNNGKTGAALSVVSFYDAMDNYEDRHMIAVTGGGYFTVKWLSLKTAVSHFDALGAYFEQTGYFSCAARIFNNIRCGVDLSGTRMHVACADGQPLTYAEAGFSLLVPLFPVFIVASVHRLPVKTSGCPGTDPLPFMQFGIHTAQHAFGAQGVRLDITPGYLQPVHCAVAQEIRLHRNFSICVALANNPLLFGVGVAATFGEGAASTAVVNHPTLGWSRGFSAEYSHQCNDRRASRSSGDPGTATTRCDK